jgi:phage baseplate assembly protein W
MTMDLKNLDPEKAFLGVGWAFPPQLEVAGAPAMAPYEEDIRQSIMIIMGTEPGERIMRPDFGAGLNRFVFEPVNTTTMALVQTRVHDSLVDWEPRIEVLEVKVTTDANEKNLLLIETSYRVRATNTLHNLVYPFYLQEATAT